MTSFPLSGAERTEMALSALSSALAERIFIKNPDKSPYFNLE